MLPGFKVTPWEVRGERVDYDILICDLRINRINKELRTSLKKFFGEENYLIEREVFFAHRALDRFIEGLVSGSIKPYVFTGRGPSGPIHIGNLVPLLLAKWLQEKLRAPLYLQISDDEKYCLRPDLRFKEVRKWARENAADLLAIGFDEERTRLIIDSECSAWLYPASLVVAKRIKVASLKESLKLGDDSNLGILYYALLQSLPAIMLPLFSDQRYACIVPMAVDQHALMTPSVLAARELGIREPAILHSIFLPGIRGEPKMGTGNPESAIFLSEPIESAMRKIERSPCPSNDLPPVLQYLRALDEHGYEEILISYLENRIEGCELAKRRAKELITSLMEKHSLRKKEFSDKVDEFVLREPPFQLEEALAKF